MRNKTAIIIGAGPAGLTAAFELLKRTDVRPVVLEKDVYMGGISKTVNYKGNRIDIGGHRFFSKSDRVMDWWLEQMPMQATGNESETIQYQRMSRSVAGGSPEAEARGDAVMLLRPRKSRIYYLRRFFEYPITLSTDTLQKLGLFRTARIGVSYIQSSMFPVKNEKSLEDFFINRFGRELYLTFFKSYTEKVWGVPCSEISAEWGAQRIKGLSVWKTLAHAAKKVFAKPGKTEGLAQKGTETSLIEKFLYPKLGPGQMWEYVAEKVKAGGGTITTRQRVDKVLTDGNRVSAIEVTDLDTGASSQLRGDYFFSTMPVRDLIRAMGDVPPKNVREVSEGLMYRDFITVGLLVNKLKIREDSESGSKLIKDNWIYIQEPDVTIGRLQIFNNWSPHLVADSTKVWLGLEYFCNDTDDIWKMADRDLIELGKQELSKIGIIEAGEVVDGTVLRVEKTYPAYFGTYDRFDEIRHFVDGFENLFLIGRNGMHRYNNQDHSMLTAMTAVDNIVAGVVEKANLWDVNTEKEYHEEKDKTSEEVKTEKVVAA